MALQIRTLASQAFPTPDITARVRKTIPRNHAWTLHTVTFGDARGHPIWHASQLS